MNVQHRQPQPITPPPLFRVQHHTWGKGKVPVLFLHGFTGNAHSFDHLAPLLGDVITATCLDLPGHRDAGLPSEEGARGFVETVDTIAKSLDKPHVVVGYSQGARLALVLAARHPRLVSRLVLESGSPGLRHRHVRVLRRLDDELRARQAEVHGVESFIDAWERLPLFAGLRALPESEQQALKSRRTSHHPHGLAGALRCLGQGVQPDMWGSLQRLRMPVLLLTGEQDKKYTHIARRMAHDLPLAWRRTFTGVGHAPHLECAQEYADELRSFIAAEWSFVH